MKLYYTCPIRAAYMSKEFGVKIQSTFCDTLRDEDQGETIVAQTVDCVLEAPYYVHPDSLPIFEPQVGDVLRLYFHTPEQDDAAGAVMTGFYWGGGEVITWFRNPGDGSIDRQVQKIDDHQWRIIQRQGNPFFWPETEQEGKE